MSTFSGFPRDGYSFSADDVGRALAGLIRRDSAGLPVPGMLGDGPKVTAVAASWRVQVGPFAFVQRVAQAIRISGVSTDEQVDIAPATAIPAGQGRIDLIAWDPAGPDLVVIPGTPSTSPVVPPNGGFEPVATVRVNSGDGTVIQGQIQPVFERTGLAGGVQRAGGVIADRSVVAGGSTPVPILFTPGLFTAPPVMTVAVAGDVRDVTASYSNLTKDGFTFHLGSVSPRGRTAGGSWTAEQF